MGDASRYNLRSSPRGPIHPSKSPQHHGSASKLNNTGDSSNLSGNESLSEHDMSVEEYNNSARSTSATPKKRGKEKTGEKKSATPQKKLTKTDFTDSPKSTTPQKELTKTDVTDSSKSANSVNTEKSGRNLLVLFMALLAVGVGTAYYFHIANTDNKPVIPLNPDLLQVFNKEMSHVQSQYPTQSMKFWKTVKISLKRIIKEANPHYPAIVMIVVPSGSKASETGSCIAKHLTKIINTLFNVTSAKVINIPSDIRHLDPDTEKKDLDVKIKESFENEHIRSIAVDHLEQLMPRASLLFHGYCDGDNAPFKDRAILFVLHTNLDKEALLNDNSLIDKYLMELWSSTDYPLDRDKIDPLIARVANNAVVISEEENLKCK